MAILAESSISFPQPFEVVDMVVWGRKKASDRIYIDHKGFCANIVLEEDRYESLEVPYGTVKSVQVSFPHPADADLKTVTVTLETTAPPIIGSQLMSQSAPDSHHGNDVVFTIERTRVVRFREALKSRGLSKLVIIGKQLKLSISSVIANLELDSSGQLVSKTERYENVSQLYGTNESSDDFGTEAVTDLKTEINAALVDHPQATPPTELSANEAATAEKSPSHDATAVGADVETDPDHGDRDIVLGHEIPTAPSSPIGVSDRIGPRDRSTIRSDIEAAKAVGRTASKMMRDAVFGASDEELSEIEELLTPPPALNTAHKTGNKYTNKLPALLMRVLDSDDEDVVEVSAKDLRKKKTIEVTDDEIEESSPMLAHPTFSKRRPSLAPLLTKSTALAPTHGPVPTEVTHSTVRSDGANVQLLDPVTPACDSAVVGAGATSLRDSPPATPLRPTCSLVPKTPEKPPKEQPSRDAPEQHGRTTDNSNSPLRDPPVILETSSSPAAIKSSPVPPKNDGVSVKDRLRKRDGTVAQLNRTMQGKLRKRKRQEEADNDESHEDILEKPAKQPRKTRSASKENGEEALVPSEITPSQVLRPRTTAAVRTKIHYRSKKMRTSSPVPSSDAIDFDSVPGDPHSVPNVSLPDARAQQVSKTEKIQSKSTARVSAMKRKIEKSSSPAVPPDSVSKNTESDMNKADKSTPGPRDSKQNDKAMQVSAKARNTRAKTRQAKEKVNEKPAEDPRSDSLDISSETLYGHDESMHKLPEKDPIGGLPRTNQPDSATITARVSDEAEADKQRIEQSILLRAQENIVVEKTDTQNTTGTLSYIDEHQNDMHDSKNAAIIDHATPEYPAKTSSMKDALTGSDHVKNYREAEAVMDNEHSKDEPSAKVTMIDLTVDSPRKSSRGEFSAKPSKIAPLPLATPAKESRSIFRHSPALGSPLGTREHKSRRSRQNVTFATQVMPQNATPTTRVILPYAGENDYGLMPKATPIQHTKQTAQRSINRSQKAQQQANKPDVGLPEILNVLDRINEAVIDRLEGRMQVVRREVQIGRSQILGEAAMDLEAMRVNWQVLFDFGLSVYLTQGNNSAERFNGLIALEAEYATFGRTLLQGFEDVAKVVQTGSAELKSCVEVHDRASKGKTPASLFPSTFPASLRRLLQD
ncbi:hypothetical protein K474DRAFT_1710728 [Panus rudis PR-1116 ss-1]|nr:hypothetical protein K474DRAFT_1710728 [Panus rudis PR-1116 ss-1]